MTEFPEHKSEKDIEQIVQQFVDAQLRGENPDIDEFVKQYPGLEDRIRQRIHNLREIDGLFASLMQPDDSDFQDTPTEHDLIGQKLGDFEIVKLIGPYSFILATPSSSFLLSFLISISTTIKLLILPVGIPILYLSLGI